MKVSPEQQRQIERLYENESLTANLTDENARALLKWAERLILANKDSQLVVAAVRAANESGTDERKALLKQASDFFKRQASQAKPISAATRNALPIATRADDDTPRMSARERKAEEMGATPDATRDASRRAEPTKGSSSDLTAHTKRPRQKRYSPRAKKPRTASQRKQIKR